MDRSKTLDTNTFDHAQNDSEVDLVAAATVMEIGAFPSPVLINQLRAETCAIGAQWGRIRSR